jgi:hypothetical protein
MASLNHCALNCALPFPALCTQLCTQNLPTVHSLSQNCALNCALTSRRNWFNYRRLAECTVNLRARFARPSRSLSRISRSRSNRINRKAVGVEVCALKNARPSLRPNHQNILSESKAKA